MLTVGITGGIATGKSFVTGLLETHGAIVFSADEAARAVLLPGGQVVAAIALAFGTGAQNEDGSLNRPYLALRIFAEEEARATLNRIMHPPVLRLLRAQMDACQNDLPSDTIVVVEVPLLFETNMQAWFERIITVTASEQVQTVRLAARSSLSEAEARSRFASQLPLEWKARHSDFVISNEGSVFETRQFVADLWLLLRQAANAKRSQSRE